jgi:hypothetical protein
VLCQAFGMPNDAWEPLAPRPLADFEKALLRRLAPEAPEDAIDSLRANGKCTCGCYSIGFERKAVTATLAGEGEAYDADGVTILLSFVTDESETEAGMLEVQRADGRPVKRIPDATELTVLRTSRWGDTRRPF